MAIAKHSASYIVSLLLVACGGGGGDPGCTGPTVTSTPPLVANVGNNYFYSVQAPYTCFFLFVPGTCPANVELLQAPSGARADNNVIQWTPTPQQVNSDAAFVIATSSGTPCHLPTQSWTVHVSP